MEDVKRPMKSNGQRLAKSEDSMRRYSVALVNAPLDVQGDASGNHTAFTSLSIITLATQITKYFRGEVEVQVIDGGLHSLESVLSRLRSLRPDMVGISVLTPTYRSGLNIAQCAKEFGAITVFGGEHACYFPKLILSKRAYVDYVVQGDGGEIALVYLVGCAIEKIPQGIEMRNGGPQRIFTRKYGEVVECAAFPKMEMKQVYRDGLDVPVLGLLGNDLDVTANNYNAIYGRLHKSERRPAVVNNVRGCSHGRQRCIYCSIWDLSINEGNARFFWQTVQTYMQDYDINFFFEVCDNFFSSHRYLRELIKACPFNPKDQDIEFEIYARASDIVEFRDTLSVLKCLNVTRVNLGLDSGDNEMLGYLEKGVACDSMRSASPVEINYEAVRMLAENGITIHGSFPLGALGETPASLKNTLEFIEGIVSRFSARIAMIEASELVPLPNSPAWDLLVFSDRAITDGVRNVATIERIAERARISVSRDKRYQLRNKYEDEDLLDALELSKDWIENFTHVSWEDIERAKEAIRNISKRAGCGCGRAI